MPSFSVLRGLKVFYLWRPIIFVTTTSPSFLALVSQSETLPHLPCGILKDQSMLKIQLRALAIAGAFIVSYAKADGFADSVINYNTGTGFSSGFTNSPVVLGSQTSSATPFAPAFRNTQLLSIGTGGSLTVKFDAPIQNDPSHPYGCDGSF